MWYVLKKYAILKQNALMEDKMNLPVTFTDKMKELLGNEYDEYIACYDETRLYGLRVNTKKICVEEFMKICPLEIEPNPWIENGFY